MFPSWSAQRGAFSKGALTAGRAGDYAAQMRAINTVECATFRAQIFPGHNTLSRRHQVARPCHQAHPQCFLLLPASVGRRGQENGGTREHPQRSGPLWPLVLSLEDKEPQAFLWRVT